MGIFNVAKAMNEKWGKEKLNSYELDFKECISDLEVANLNFNGCFYAWINNIEGEHLWLKSLIGLQLMRNGWSFLEELLLISLLEGLGSFSFY